MTSQPQLVPKLPKRLHQPRKALLREHLAAAADTIIAQAETIESQREQLETLRAPWWRRLWRIK